MGAAGGGLAPARASETSISAWVRFLDLRNATRWSNVELITEGSRRTTYGMVRIHDSWDV